MKDKNKIIYCLLILLVIFIMVILGIWVGKLSRFGTPTTPSPVEPSSTQKTVKFHELRTLDLGEGIFANIIFAREHFYLSYEAMGQGIFLKIYDKDFNFQAKRQLSGKEGADHQMVFQDGYFYLATSFNLRKFAADWQEIKSVNYFEQLPEEIKAKWSNGTNDMLLAAGENSLYLGMASGNIAKEDKAQKKDVADDLYLQKYNPNLELKKDFLLKGLGNTPGSSLIENNNGFTIITANKHWDDSSLLAASYDKDGQQLDQKTISAKANINEEFPMAALRHNNTYFVSYEYISGDLAQPTQGEPVRRIDVAMKAFDQDWNLLDQIIVTQDLTDDELRTHLRAPHLAFVNDKLYLAYSLESNGPKMFVKEYEIE